MSTKKVSQFSSFNTHDGPYQYSGATNSSKSKNFQYLRPGVATHREHVEDILRSSPSEPSYQVRRQGNEQGGYSNEPDTSIQPKVTGTKKFGFQAFQQALKAPSVSKQSHTKLFFKPLNKHSTEDSVYEVLKHLGKIESLRVPFSFRKRKNLGYGLVTFTSADVASCLVTQKLKIIIDGTTVGFESYDNRVSKIRRKMLDNPHINDHATASMNILELHQDQTNLMKVANTTEIVHPRDFVHQTKPTKKSYFEATRNPSNDNVRYCFNIEGVAMKQARNAMHSLNQTPGSLNRYFDAPQ